MDKEFLKDCKPIFKGYDNGSDPQWGILLHYENEDQYRFLALEFCCGTKGFVVGGIQWRLH
ncbi:hypothetical protein SEA_GUEY18_147 [Gordonia phage Guey18]|nr:hypothetical protein SEA_GUEY18_147 [Gordonia phage Guey18]